MHFRQIPKQRVDVLLPEALEGRLRAARGRQSLSQVVASALCLLFDEDPRHYGLPPWAERPASPESPATRSAPTGGSPSGGPAR